MEQNIKSFNVLDLTLISLITVIDPRKATTKAGGIEIRPLSEHQNSNLENVHITTATLIKFAQKIVY